MRIDTTTNTLMKKNFQFLRIDSSFCISKTYPSDFDQLNFFLGYFLRSFIWDKIWNTIFPKLEGSRYTVVDFRHIARGNMVRKYFKSILRTQKPQNKKIEIIKQTFKKVTAKVRKNFKLPYLAKEWSWHEKIFQNYRVRPPQQYVKK